MMKLLTVAAMVGTLLTTLTMIVFCLGMGANASPAEIRTLKLWMVGFALLGTAGMVAAIVLMRAGQTGWAAGAAIAPAGVMAIVALVALLQ